MLSGRFGDTSGRPYLEGRLLIPRLGLTGDFSFLVDTGADRTFLMPGDGRTLGLDYGNLQNHDNSARGASGPISSYREPAWVAFSDGSNLYGYSITLAILGFRSDMLTVPTLLGRDVLHRWTINYCHSRDCLEFDVESADVVVPLDGSGVSPTRLHQ